MRARLNTPELHAKYVQAHEGRAILHAHKIEDMLDHLESGEIESDIARVSLRKNPSKRIKIVSAIEIEDTNAEKRDKDKEV